jgi:hypothetical protein
MFICERSSPRGRPRCMQTCSASRSSLFIGRLTVSVHPSARPTTQHPLQPRRAAGPGPHAAPNANPRPARPAWPSGRSARNGTPAADAGRSAAGKDGERILSHFSYPFNLVPLAKSGVKTCPPPQSHTPARQTGDAGRGAVHRRERVCGLALLRATGTRICCTRCDGRVCGTGPASAFSRVSLAGRAGARPCVGRVAKSVQEQGFAGGPGSRQGESEASCAATEAIDGGRVTLVPLWD